MDASKQSLSHIPELLSCIGTFVKNRRLLYNLCLTSKSFKSTFSPFLYKEFCFTAKNEHVLIGHLQALLDNPSLKHVEKLDFSIDDHALGSAAASRDPLCQLYNESVQALVKRMPGLRDFCWANQPMLPTTLPIIGEQCLNVRCLRICHPSNIEEILGIAFEYTFDQDDGFSELRPPLARLDIPTFPYLAELELHELHGDLIRVRAGIVQSLLQSPHLKSLSLSINADTMFRLQERGLHDHYFDFLEDLTKDFKQQGGKPLKLRKLVLGFGVLLWQDYEGAPAKHLENLTDPICLEDVYICNKSHHDAFIVDDPDCISWSTFTPSICPNLRIVGIYRGSETVESWLQQLEPGYLEELRIEDTFGYSFSSVGALLTGDDPTFRSLIIMDASDSLDYGDFSALRFPTLQVLAIGLWQITPDIESPFLDWIGAMASMEQLYLGEIRPCLERAEQDYEALGRKIGLQNKKLRYLKIGKYAWRIWHSLDVCNLEILDIFEQRDIGFPDESFF